MLVANYQMLMALIVFLFHKNERCMPTKTTILRPFEGFQDKFVRSNLDLVIGGGALSGGKMNPLYTKVLTPNGWVRMGDLNVGDLVCTPFGKPCAILKIFEHKDKDIYEVETEDGRKSRCGLEHLWSFRNDVQLFKYLNTHHTMSLDLTTDDTSAMIRMLDNGDDVYLPISNEQTFDKGYYDVSSLDICGKDVRFIPRECLWGSIEDRKTILKKAISTYGSKLPNGVILLTIPYWQLADDLVFICRSLGIVAISEDKDNGECVVTISEELTRRRHVKIKSIKKVDRCDARCIWIDDRMHLYIIDDFMVTHNTAAAVFMCAEPSLDGRFRACFLRNNLGDLKSGGGILDEFKKMYGEGCSVVESGDPHIDFPSGARVDVTHIADQSLQKISQRFKGRQYDLIYFDEGTGFTWECFTYLFSRNRGIADWTGKVRMTTNPERDHWLRTFLDWYIGADGRIIPEREGVVRYFFVYGKSVKEVAQGETKEDVYRMCKAQIDRVLRNFNGKNGTATYKDMIKSFTFYEGKTSENKAILNKNSGYIGSIAVSGETETQKNLEANWNVSSHEGLDIPIPYEDAYQVFMNDEQTNGDKWVTCDLADSGTDNFLCLAWDGFHIFDYLILKTTTPRENAERLQMFAIEHDIADDHIIYDAIRGTYINDYIPDAVPFMSSFAPIGLYKREAYNLKAECYLRVVEAVKRGYISFSEDVSNKVYEHQMLKTPITIANEFVEECMVVRFREMPSGKKALYSKKEMNTKLGKNRSMDLLDPIAMRFYPVLQFGYGEELEKSASLYDSDVDEHGCAQSQSIYDVTLYGG